MKQILLIEESSMMRTFIIAFLGTDKRYNIISCENAKAALIWLESNKADLILAGHNLNSIDELQFIQTIRQQKKLAHLPIIVLSTVKDSIKRLKILELGASDYLQKPFSPQELEFRIERNIKIAQQKSLISTFEGVEQMRPDYGVASVKSFTKNLFLHIINNIHNRYQSLVSPQKNAASVYGNEYWKVISKGQNNYYYKVSKRC
jgi:DNA-binding response OmpR family regulator